MSKLAQLFADPDAPRPGYAPASVLFLEGRAKAISTIPRVAMVERGIEPDHWIAAAHIAERRLLPLARAGYHINRIESAFERCICRAYNARRMAATKPAA